MQFFSQVASRWTLALAATLALVFVADAQAQAPLRWKFKQGEDLNYILDRGMEGKINFSGAEIEFKLGLTMDVTWKVTEVASSGTASVAQTIDRVQMKLDSPLFGSMEYDSADPNSTAGPIQPMIEGMLGQTFQLKVTAAGKVEEVKLPEKLSETFAEAGQGRGQAGLGIGGNMFSERGVKELIEESVLPLPEGAPVKGATWKRKFDNEIKEIGVQSTETTFSYVGTEKVDGKELVKIEGKTELTFEPAQDPKGELEITTQEGSSVIYFDATAGRVVKSEGKQTTAIELSGAQELTQDLKATSGMRVGKSPAPEKKEEEKK